ncbi:MULTISPECIES: HNH endonuclease family protein [Corynebacterium]|nr:MULTISPECIES: HNH endonuclease family protein [Corynebacterium]
MRTSFLAVFLVAMVGLCAAACSDVSEYPTPSAPSSHLTHDAESASEKAFETQDEAAEDIDERPGEDASEAQDEVGAGGDERRASGQVWAHVVGVTGMNTADVWTQWETLAVAGRAPKTGYERGQFGQRWKDVDRNGCDQRNDVLARDMTNIVAPKGCKVLSGHLVDPFTGEIIEFQRGPKTSNAVHIDHVVPLADAWQKGAQGWTPERREQFANDPMNLLAVDGLQNQKKSAGDAATWLPPNSAFRCQYVATQIRVKHEYGLWVTEAEKDAMARELGRCGDRVA